MEKSIEIIAEGNSRFCSHKKYSHADNWHHFYFLHLWNYPWLCINV